MQPEFQQPITPPSTPPRSSKKKAIIIAIIAAAVLIGIIVMVLTIMKPRQTENKPVVKVENTTKTVAFGTVADPIVYAGNTMYDACNLVPINLLKTHIEKYDELFNSMSSERHAKDPLVIDHGYVDRTIQNAIGKDGTIREPSVSVGTTSVDTSIRASSFMSIADSHCTYAQGANFNTKFADVYVLQQPRPLHPKLVAYLDALKQKGKMAIESQGVQVYIEPVKEGDDAYTAIFKKGNTVVFFASRQQALVQAASTEIVKTLAKEPSGPASITYPALYSKLVNTCELLPADDFERLLGKPASALAVETWFITESEENTAKRVCSRIESERFGQAEISSTEVGLSESRTQEQTKLRLETIKKDSSNTIAPLKELGDEAYVVTRGTGASAGHSIVIRSGKVLLTILSSGEAKDATSEQFISRTQPIARAVYAHYEKLASR